MKKLVLLFLLISMISVAIPCAATFPEPDYYELYTMRQGYNDGQEIWFISTTTSSIRYASSSFLGQLWNPYFDYPPVLSWQLDGALDSVARPVYLVTNFSQGPVFDTVPGAEDYSALWQVFTVTWKDEDFKRGIKNTEPASDLNPYGLPPVDEADIVETGVVVDLPIVAVGPLGGSWQHVPSGGYRIAQAADYDPASIQKWILLPHYYVFSNNPNTKKQMEVDVLITDTDNEDIAKLLGANYAPGLSQMPDSNVRNFWAFNSPYPVSQLPVVEEVPTATSLNSNTNYSPVMDLVYLDRNIPGYVAINNKFLLEKLIVSGGLVPGDTYRINANAVNMATYQ
ncbi:MAG: hypothetical protein ABFD49_07800 [Armatimonadota bacterium]|nr:hypothetical protein [bacterium]